MNALTREIESLLKKPSVQDALVRVGQEIVLKLIQREFLQQETDVFQQITVDDRVACYVLTLDDALQFFPETSDLRRAYSLAEKQMTHLPLFPNEKTEEKMVLVPVPRYCNRKLLREIFANTKITKTDAAKVAEILTDYKNKGHL